MCKLLEAIEKVSDYESGAIVENCRNELQMNDILSENMKFKIEQKKYLEEINSLQDLVQTLNIEKKSLTIRLIKKGDYKIENQNEDKSNENVEEIKNERDMYKGMLSEETKNNSRNKFQQEVSSERIIQTRAFKNLINQGKALRKKLDVYKERNDNLYKYKDDYKDNFRKECHLIMQKEEEKRETLSNEIKAIHARLAEAEKEKSEALIMLENLKKINNENKNNKNWQELIEILITDKESLKSKNNDLAQKLAEMTKKNEDYELRKYEISQEPEIVKMHKTIEDLKQKLKNEHLTVESLISEIELTGNAYEKLEEKTKSFSIQLAEQEVLYNKLMNEKVKESS